MGNQTEASNVTHYIASKQATSALYTRSFTACDNAYKHAQQSQGKINAHMVQSHL